MIKTAAPFSLNFLKPSVKHCIKDYIYIYTTRKFHNHNMSNKKNNSTLFPNNNANKNRKRNIIWFGSTRHSVWMWKSILEKTSYKLLTNISHVLVSYINKIINHNTVKVSFSCTLNFQQIFKRYNKKLTSRKEQKSVESVDCNCTRKQ